MKGRYVASIVLIITIGGICLGKHGSSGLLPKFSSAYLEYRDALVGMDMYAGARFDYDDFLTIEPNVFTYYTGSGWQTFGGILQFKLKPLEKIPAKFDIWAGGQWDIVDLSDRTNPGSGLSATKYSRMTPTFGVGAGVDSIPFFCKGCDYHFSGRILLGDFIPIYTEFDGLSSTTPETLSTVVVTDVTLGTPYGAASIVRHYRARGWFGDNYWRISYTSPFCCGGLARGRIGWESGYLGFADIEVRIAPISIITGVKMPVDYSIWTWHTGIIFQPPINRYNTEQVNKRGSGDIEVLAPAIRSPWE